MPTSPVQLTKLDSWGDGMETAENPGFQILKFSLAAHYGLSLPHQVWGKLALTNTLRDKAGDKCMEKVDCDTIESSGDSGDMKSPG